jgi:hypothetical protein
MLPRTQEPKPGTRVIAISHEEEDALYIFGYGVYEGRYLSPLVNLDEELKSFKAEINRARRTFPFLPELPDEELRKIVSSGLSNPRIKLDNGKTVWGYECWWSSMEGIDIDSIEDELGKKIVVIDIEAERKKYIN